MSDVNLEMDVRVANDDRTESPGLISRLLSPWTAIILGVLCYLPMLPNHFVRDDVWLIELNPRVRNVADFRAVWLTDWWDVDLIGYDIAPEESRDRLYRPLTLFTFALQAAIHGVEPFWFRVVNIALHAAVCGLLWIFARRLIDDPAVATIASVLFAVHPIHAEALGEIVGRAELLSAFFMLTGLIALLPRPDGSGRARSVLASLAFMLALLSKETAICYPLVAGLIVWTRSRVGLPALRPGEKLRLAAILLLPLLIYLALRYFALEGQFVRPAVMSTIVNPLKDAPPWERIHAPLTILGQYATLMLVPIRLNSSYGLAVLNPAAGPNASTLIGLIVAIALIGASGRWLWEMIRAPATQTAAGMINRPAGLLGLLAAVFLASYALISNTFLLIGTSMGERLFYWPSVPILIALALLVVRHWRSRALGRELSLASALLAAGGAMAILLLAGRTALRGLDWRDNLTLFRIDYAAHPESVMNAEGLAKELTRRAGAMKSSFEREPFLIEADNALVKALTIHAGNPTAIQQRGFIFELRGQRQKAAELFQIAIQMNPNDRASRAALARVGGASADQQAWLAAAAQRVSQTPDDPQARIDYAGRLLMAGRAAEAAEQYAVATRLAPEQASAFSGYSQALLLAGRNEEALPVLRKAIELNPGDWRSHTNLVRLLINSDPPAALEHAKKAVAIQPTDLDARLNLAESFAANRKHADAVALLREILNSLAPADINRPLIEGRIRKFESR